MSLEIIGKIFADKFKPVNQTKLEEVNTGHTGARFVMKREIQPGSLEYLLYRPDPNSCELFPLFKHSDKGGLEGMRKVCDYFLFVKNAKDELFVFLIELKKGNECPKEQLNASECLINYILDLSKLSGTPLDEAKVKIRKIGMKENDGKRKRTTRRGAWEYDHGFLQYYHETHFRIKELLT